MKLKPTDFIFPAVLLMFLFVNHFNFIYSDSNVDFNFNAKGSFKTFFYSWDERLALGESNLWSHTYIFPYGALYLILSLLFNYWITQVLIYFIFLSIGYFSFLIFIRNEFKDLEHIEHIEHLGAMFFTLNPYTIIIITGSTFVHLLPYIIIPAQLYLLNRILFSEKIKYTLIFGITLLITGGINPPLTAISFGIMTFYLMGLLISNRELLNRSLIKKIFITSLVTLCLNLFWVLSILSHFLSSNSNLDMILSEPLSMHSQESTYLNVFRMMSFWSLHSQWSGEPYINYAFYFLENTFVTLSIFVLVTFLITPLLFDKKIKKPWWIYALIVTSIPMTVAIREGLFVQLYLWAYDNLPLFAMFRTNRKFLSVYSLALSYLIVLSLSKIKRTTLKKLSCLILICTFIIVSIPFFNGDIFEPRRKINSLPEDYLQVKDFFQEKNSIYRVLLLPDQYFAVYTWGNTEDNIEKIWQKPLVVTRPIGLDHINNIYTEKIRTSLSNDTLIDFNKYIKILNIDYIVLRKDFDWKFYPKYSEDPLRLEQVLDAYYRHDSFEKLKVYVVEEKLLSAHIFSKIATFQKINPTKYKIHISELSDKQNLSFLESHHSGWKLYLKKNPSNDWCNPIEFYNNTNTTECEHTLKFFEGEEFSYLWKKPIFDKMHTMVYDYANQWTIDPQYIKDNYPREYYKENPDGRIDIEMVMYFKPQSYFYLGLIISGTTLILCIGYLVYDWRKNRNKNHNVKVNI